MRKIFAVVTFLSATNIANAQMDELTFLQEIEALAKTIALQEQCSIQVNDDAMINFVGSHFEYRESDVLSTLDGHVTLAQFQLKSASELQKKLLCAAAKNSSPNIIWNQPDNITHVSPSLSRLL